MSLLHWGMSRCASKWCKAAQGRITAWLDRIDPDAPASPVTSTPNEVDEQPPAAPEIHNPPIPRDPSPRPVIPQRTAESQPEVDAAPNPRSSGFMPMSTLRANRKEATPTKPQHTGGAIKLPPNLQKCLPAYPPRPLDPEVRYDVRSARGGRGGKVTAVAAIWASALQSTATAESPRTQTPRPVVPAKIAKPTPFVAPSVEKTREVKAPPPRPRTAERLPRHAGTPSHNNDTTSKMPARRAKVVKSASVPAVVSSSLATPTISTTASLARPAALTTHTNRPPLKTQISSGIPEVVSPKPSVAAAAAVKGEMAFGQARLKELIKKYQGQASA